MPKLLHIILLAAILLLSFLLSTKMIITGDFFYLSDQARDYLLAQDIVDNRNITLIGTHSGLGGFFHGPLWLYLLTPFYIIGGGDPLIFTYLYVLVAVVTVFFGYVVGTRLYNKNAGLLLAFLLAVSPSIWLFVPFTIGANLVPLVFLFMFYFLVKYIRGDKNAFIFVAFFAGLSLHFETALPLLIFPVIFFSFFLNKKAFKKPKIIIFSILSFMLSVSTFILFDLRHNFLMTRALLTLFSGEKSQGYLAFPERLYSHIETFKGVYTSVLIQDTLLLKLLFVSLIIATGIIVYKKQLYKSKNFSEFMYLILFPILMFFLYLLYAYPIYSEYVFGLTVPIAMAITYLVHTLRKHTIIKLLIVLFVSVTLFEAGISIATPHKQNTTSGSYKNQQDVAEWIIKDSGGKEFGYYVYTAETYTYGMDYLMSWKAKKYNFPKPESKKLPTTYLILYPTLEGDAGAHAFWKKHKIKTTAAVSLKKEFSGGIIVEKLSIKPGEEPSDPSYHQNLIFR